MICFIIIKMSGAIGAKNDITKQNAILFLFFIVHFFSFLFCSILFKMLCFYAKKKRIENKKIGERTSYKRNWRPLGEEMTLVEWGWCTMIVPYVVPTLYDCVNLETIISKTDYRSHILISGIQFCDQICVFYPSSVLLIIHRLSTSLASFSALQIWDGWDSNSALI